MVDKTTERLFEMQRYNVISTKLNKETEDCIPDSYAYAWYARVYPLADSGIHELYADSFRVTESQVELVITYADSEWLKGNVYTFYEYEDHFKVRSGNEHGIDRSSLINIFRYYYVNGGFDDKFWAKLVTPMQHPAEAASITMDFKSHHLYLV